MSKKYQNPKKKIVIGFLLIGDGNWKGGLNYQKILLKIISTHLSDIAAAKIFVSEDQCKIAEEAFNEYLDELPIVDSRVAKAGTGLRAVKALITGSDKLIEDLFNEHNVDIVFETAHFFGKKFSLPCISWIPDLQHKYLPQYFSFFSWWKREIGLWAQTRFIKKRLILLSSVTAQKDCEFFYPKCINKTHVMKFSQELDHKKIDERIPIVRSKYNLPNKYFYLPNHFWAHKNHNLVLEALLKIREQGLIKSLPPIIMSGPKDFQKSKIFNTIISRIKSEKLEPYISYIGLIPYDDVLSLNAGAKALINPSKFEGWSSSVEEAKFFGTRMILSDILVHREQAAYADFFHPESSSELAKALLNNASKEFLNTRDIKSLKFEAEDRINKFSISFKSAIIKTYNLKN